MARSTTSKLRGIWLQIHKWIGILLAILIIPLSLSGAALVWHDALDEALNPHRYSVVGEWQLRPSQYASAAKGAMEQGERLVSLRYPQTQGLIVATVVSPPRNGKSGRPVRSSIWLDPVDAHVIDRARNDAGLVRFLHVLHGNLQIPGVGRQVVGWIGVAMLLSSMTGLWLWWPLSGGLRRGLRWRRQNALSPNLHHVAGFWIAIPLAMLSFTGAWISFPAFFGAISGAPSQKGPDRARAQNALPLEKTRLYADMILAIPPHGESSVVSITWPTDLSPEWKIVFAEGPKAGETKVDDATGTITPPRPAQPETLARTMRRWHDGTGMGPIWQLIIFIGGIAPALLAITGIIMWLRSRGWRARLRRKRHARA
ncbi:MAG: PepSY-associated TM helix domain-containing protein [Allosphingosinicella sp.]